MSKEWPRLSPIPATIILPTAQNFQRQNVSDTRISAKKAVVFAMVRISLSNFKFSRNDPKWVQLLLRRSQQLCRAYRLLPQGEIHVVELTSTIFKTRITSSPNVLAPVAYVQKWLLYLKSPVMTTTQIVLKLLKMSVFLFANRCKKSCGNCDGEYQLKWKRYSKLF